MSLGQIKNQSLREQVRDKLREAILSGQLKPGQPLIETELAEQFGVSRAPLREAIHILNTEGLLETIPYHGTTVKALTRTDVEELYSLRSALESFAVARIIKRNDGPETRLRDIMDRMRKAAITGDYARASQLDRAFHDELIALSDHHLLHETWQPVSRRVQQVMALRPWSQRNPVEIADSHAPIIVAIAARDLAAAQIAVEEHIATSGDVMVGYWSDEEH